MKPASRKQRSVAESQARTILKNDKSFAIMDGADYGSDALILHLSDKKLGIEAYTGDYVCHVLCDDGFTKDKRKIARYLAALPELKQALLKTAYDLYNLRHDMQLEDDGAFRETAQLLRRAGCLEEARQIFKTLKEDGE